MSKIEVNTVEPQCGTTLTLGASGDTITFPSGTTVVNNGSQTGFGRTGTVDWQTGSIKTSTFTAANGEGYFANTSGGAFTMNLPAGTAGNIVSVVDYTNTFQTNNLTITPNGSEKIGGVNASFVASTEGQSLTFVYVDGTEGWKNVQDSTSNAIGNPFLQATGGTITTSGNCKIHTFTGPGTFTVSSISTNCAAENVVSYMVVAGGGGGGNGSGGGGGGGGFREVKTPLTPYTASPLDGYPSAPNRVTVTATAYPITVGGGGSGVTYGVGPAAPATGSNSVFSTITSAGGGGGGGGPGAAANGGSGGGGNGGYSTAGGSGNTPPVSPAQGSNGGTGGVATNYVGGGGGGATAAGTNHSTNQGGPGGAGATSSINGTPTARAGGGGGGAENSTAGSGGTGGGGAGSQSSPASGTNGTINTGGGGGGGGMNGSPSGGSIGGSGIVIIRYKYK